MHDLIRDFIMETACEGELSSLTLDAYALDLTVFFRYVALRQEPEKNKSIDFELIDTKGVTVEVLSTLDSSFISDFDRFMANTRGNKAASRRRKLVAIRAYFGYLRNDYLIDFNPVLDVPKPVVLKAAPEALSLTETKQLLASVDGIHKTRDYAILLLFLSTGLRISQVCNLTVADDHGRFLKIADHPLLRVPVNDALRAALDDYLELRSGLTCVDGHYFFLSSRMTGLKRRSIYQLVKKHLAAAGLDATRYCPNSLRHTCAMLLISNNPDLQTVASLLGHASAGSTQIYVGRTSLDDAEAAMFSHPLNVLL